MAAIDIMDGYISQGVSRSDYYMYLGSYHTMHSLLNPCCPLVSRGDLPLSLAQCPRNASYLYVCTKHLLPCFKTEDTT